MNSETLQFHHISKRAFPFCVVLLIFGITMAALRGQDEPQDLSEAREVYKKEVEFASRSIREKYLSKLEILKRALGSKGDARGALAVEQEIDRVKASAADAAGVAKFAGTWRIHYSNNFTRRYIINGDGFVTYSEENGKPIPAKRGRIVLRNSKYTLDLKEAGFEVLTLSENALKTELFDSKDAFAAGTPAYVGVSTTEGRIK